MSIWRRVYEDRRALALPLLIALVVSIAVWLVGVLPLRARLSAAEADAREAAVELVNARRIADQASQAALGRRQADAQLQAFYGSVLPADYPTAVKTTNAWVQQAAADAGLTFRSSRFERESVEDSRLSRAVSQMSLTGQYADFRRFLHALEVAEEFIVLERVELVDSTANQQGGGAIGIEAVVSTYFQDSGAR